MQVGAARYVGAVVKLMIAQGHRLVSQDVVASDDCSPRDTLDTSVPCKVPGIQKQQLLSKPLAQNTDVAAQRHEARVTQLHAASP